jgi:hypothetical protein
LDFTREWARATTSDEDTASHGAVFVLLVGGIHAPLQIGTDLSVHRRPAMRAARKEKAPADANRTEAPNQKTTRGDGTPLSPALVKLIHLLAAAAVRQSIKKGDGS